MSSETLSKLINRLSQTSAPAVEFLNGPRAIGERTGIFASSFDPPTHAHLDLMRQARKQFALSEVIALVGVTNADKHDYDCSLEDRLKMIELALSGDPLTSVAISSHAYFVDIVDAFELMGVNADLHFIIGFDTFERVLDPEDRYTTRYHRKFRDRSEALNYLASHSSLIVAGRGQATAGDVRELMSGAPLSFAQRVQTMDVPAELRQLSASEVRKRIRARQEISGLVPASVAQYITERGLYS